ncbi:MAG: flagellar basal body-associated FliL family protein [Deltaproteobacteria bacterium]|nr:flagellar basal body-associated FliL family protein [Deltaproteobacteria bacterium]
MGEETAKSNSKKLKSLIFLALGLFIIAGSGVAGWFLLSVREEETLQEEQSQEFEEQNPEEIVVGSSYALNPFTINLKDGKFLRFTIALRFQDSKIPNIFFIKEYELRDKLIEFFNQKKADEVINPEARNEFKKVLVEIFNNSLGAPLIKDVLFLDLVAQ